MENDQLPTVSVGDFVAYLNQTLEMAYPSVSIEGEVEGFKVNQGKYVFFNLKDAEASVGCFMMVYALRVPIEDGMKVVVRARPKLTPWGKFSLTIESIRPSGEGSIKKSFELLKRKLDKEGLFSLERKRALPAWPKKVAIISSVQSAGYADFMKIANDRIGGVEFLVYHTLVQGADAPDQLIQALKKVNELDEVPEVVVIVRGGGSADDLASFNDEALARAIAASRVPTLVGVGHEIDVTLADMVADVRAATPSNAAQLLLPDKDSMLRRIEHLSGQLLPRIQQVIRAREQYIEGTLVQVRTSMLAKVEERIEGVKSVDRLLASYNPARVLARGYAIVRGRIEVGESIKIETQHEIITAEVVSHEQK